MQQMIRKEVSESSWKDESEGQGRVRRSRRAPVPNTLYREALKELKKTGKIREAATSTRRKVPKRESSSSWHSSELQQWDCAATTQWLKCLLPDGGQGSRLIDLEVVVGSASAKDSVHADSNNPGVLAHQSKSSLPDDHEDLPLEVLAQSRPRRKVKLDKPGENKHGLLYLLRTAVQKVTQQMDLAAKENTMEEESAQVLKETCPNAPSQPTYEALEQTPKKKLMVHYPWKLVQPHQFSCESSQETVMQEEKKAREPENSSFCFFDYQKQDLKFQELTNRFESFKQSLRGIQKAN